MQLQSWVGIFAQHHTERRAVAGPLAFNGLCDDEGVPLICPTCQVLARSVLAGGRLLLCMGLFSIFLVGSHSDAAARYPASATSKVAATRSRCARLLVGTTLKTTPKPLIGLDEAARMD